MEEDSKITTMDASNEEMSPQTDNTVLPVEDKPKKGNLKMKCKCGNCVNISDDIIEDGLTWTMLIGPEHYLTLRCDKCDSELTMFLEEIVE